MGLLPAIVIGLEVAFFIFCAIMLVVFIIKRIEDKKNETFEDRDN